MTAIVQRDIVAEICRRRDAALGKVREAVEMMAEADKLAREGEHEAQHAYSMATFCLDDKRGKAYRRIFEPVNAAESLEAYRRQLDARTWMNLFALTGINDLMDATAKNKTYNDLMNAVPEVTEDNVWATLENMMGNAKVIFQRGLAVAFTSLDRRFRSHDAFKLGSRIILTGVFDDWGTWRYGTQIRDTITDIERVFTVLDQDKPDPELDKDGKPIPPISLVNLIDQDRQKSGYGRRQSLTESTYFRIRTFQNGNAHFWFTRDDLVEKANLLLAEYYGQALPDGIPAEEVFTQRDIKQRSTALCKDLSFYPTPDGVIQTILSRFDGLGPGCHVLEPSAGTGSIARAVLQQRVSSVHCVEVEPVRVAALESIGKYDRRVTVEHANFLNVHPNPRFTHVFMNPPFFGTHYMQHVMHAWEFLRPGGYLVAILPATVEFGETKAHDAFRKWLDARSEYKHMRTFHDLPQGSFATSGTNVSTCYIILRKSS